MNTKPKKMKVTGIQCPRCDEKIWSRHGHDFRYCGCGYCFVDGGRNYLRTGHGVTPDKPNDGYITREEWAAIDEENKRIGVPKMVTMFVPRPPERKPQEFPYPGYLSLFLRAEELAKKEVKKIEKQLKDNVKAHAKVKVKLPKEETSELPKPRNRIKADSVRPTTGGSKRRPRQPIRAGKDKATVRK